MFISLYANLENGGVNLPHFSSFYLLWLQFDHSTWDADVNSLCHCLHIFDWAGEDSEFRSPVCIQPHT